jgi:molecular chaperone GrpE
MKDKMKEKDEEKLDEMKKEIDEAEQAPGSDKEKAAEVKQPAEKPAAEADPDAKEPDAEELQQQVDKLEAQLQDREDRVARLQADFDNFRRRTRQEKEELGIVVTQDILQGMLPLLDNFERAMQSESKDREAFQSGVEMIYKSFQETLQKDGLEVIKTEGEKFDPNFHQAVMRVQDEDKEDDTIVAELQKGYVVKGKVIRPSMVQVVSN